jgi:hypothetical protein
MSYTVGENVLDTMLRDQEHILQEIDRLPVEREKEVICYEEGYKETVSKTDILAESGKILLLRIIDRKTCVVEFKEELTVIAMLPYLKLSDELFKKCGKRKVLIDDGE